MKTVTEFSGFFLRGALKIRQELFQKKKLELKEAEKNNKKVDDAPEVLESSATEAQVQSEGETPSVETVEATETIVAAETSEAPAEEISASESSNESSSEPSEPKVTSENAAPAQGGLQLKPKQKPKNWVEVSDDDLKAALAEGLKVEGEKLDFILNAIKAVDRKREEDLKRVVVSTLEEGEKQPEAARLLGTHLYLAEYLPSLRPVVNKERNFNKRFNKNGKGRGGGRGRDGGGKGRGNDRNRGEGNGSGRGFDKSGRSAGGPRKPFENGKPAGDLNGSPSAPTGNGNEEKKHFRPRKPFVKKPRVQQEPQPPGTVLIKI